MYKGHSSLHLASTIHDLCDGQTIIVLQYEISFAISDLSNDHDHRSGSLNIDIPTTTDAITISVKKRIGHRFILTINGAWLQGFGWFNKLAGNTGIPFTRKIRLNPEPDPE